MSTIILGLGNPFCDRTKLVDDVFLEQNSLQKGFSLFTDDKALVDASWDSVKKTEADTSWSIGGSGTNVIKTLARLGNRCALYGKIGTDDIGEEIVKRLDQIGITSLLTKGEKETGTVNCFVSPTGERTMYAYTGVCEEFSEKNVFAEQFQNVKHLHLEGYAVDFGDAVETSISFAKENNATISMDLAGPNIVQIFRPKFENSLPKVDFIFGNVQEMQTFTGIDNIKEAVEKFHLNQTVVATNGGAACWVKAKGESNAEQHTTPEVVGVIDTTGAGDFFAAGFLHGAFQGKSVPQCVKMAHLVARFVIQQIGADLPDKKWIELNEQIAKV